MCGIAGIVALNGANVPVEAEYAVRDMLNAMQWRGPDGEGLWRMGAACFGHRRLSIIDLTGGGQPMSYGGGNYTTVFNGEIYPYRELRKELQKEGYQFSNESDTEVLLASYAKDGLKCLQNLEGMFAFALWDDRKKRLFAARDHFGKKPFYYTIQKGYLAFASELSSLATLKLGKFLPPFNFSVSPSAFTRYLAYEYVPVPQSIYKEVSVLEPSHFLTLQNGEVKIAGYWDLPFPEQKLPAPLPEVEEELRQLMERAVKLRMISDVPLGVFLSGGIDSTIITGLMANFSSSPVKAFSIGFREASYDESKYARIAAKAYGVELTERILSAADCAKELPELARKMDTPMADASAAPTWLLSSLTREKVTVALGGDGSDEFWAGYEHYIGYKIALIYNRSPGFLQSFINWLTKFLPESSGYINPRQAIRTFLAGAAAPDWLRVQMMLTSFNARLQKEIFSKDWLAAQNNDILAPEVLFASTARHYYHWQDRDVKPLERAFYVYIRQFMLDDILVKVDRCSMLQSLEVRAPFLDKKVTEFVARLPVSAKLSGFKRKWLLKKAFAKILPPEILKRNKRGFQIPVADWLRGQLKPLLLEFLSPEFLARQGIFNPVAIEKMMQEHFWEKRDYRKQLWTLLVIQLWLDANRVNF